MQRWNHAEQFRRDLSAVTEHITTLSLALSSAGTGPQSKAAGTRDLTCTAAQPNVTNPELWIGYKDTSLWLSNTHTINRYLQLFSRDIPLLLPLSLSHTLPPPISRPRLCRWNLGQRTGSCSAAVLSEWVWGGGGSFPSIVSLRAFMHVCFLVPSEFPISPSAAWWRGDGAMMVIPL